MLNKTDKIWMNGQMVAWDDAQVHVLTNALHYGSGVFEGIRCYETEKGPAVFRLKDHISRLFYSAKCLGIGLPFTQNQLEKAVVETVKVNNLKECYIRPIVFCGYGVIDLDITNSEVNTSIISLPLKVTLDYKVISGIISSYQRISPKAVPIDAKINGYYVNSILATLEAKKAKADEAILLDDNGDVAEGAGENIFLVKNGQVYTPALGYILPGITRNSVIQIIKDNKINVIEKKISVQELQDADEVFFTGTWIEVCPVVEINKRKLGDGKTGKITRMTTDKFQNIVRGKDKNYLSWLSFV